MLPFDFIQMIKAVGAGGEKGQSSPNSKYFVEV